MALLKVDTQQLKTVANEVRKQLRTMRQDFESLQTIASRSSYYWQGQVADEFRKAVDEQKGPTDEALRRLSKIPDDLEMMAGIYEGTESKAQKTASTLPTDYI